MVCFTLRLRWNRSSISVCLTYCSLATHGLLGSSDHTHTDLLKLPPSLWIQMQEFPVHFDTPLPRNCSDAVLLITCGLISSTCLLYFVVAHSPCQCLDDVVFGTSYDGWISCLSHFSSPSVELCSIRWNGGTWSESRRTFHILWLVLHVCRLLRSEMTSFSYRLIVCGEIHLCKFTFKCETDFTGLCLHPSLTCTQLFWSFSHFNPKWPTTVHKHIHTPEMESTMQVDSQLIGCS